MQLADITSRYRGKLIVKAFKHWLNPGDKVLDVGCGNGIISDLLIGHFDLDLVGCDTLSYLDRPIKFVLMKKETKLPFKDSQFDVVMYIDMLHHTPYEVQKALLKEGLRVGKKVVMFELKPTLMGTLADWLINKVHNKKMSMTFTYKSYEEWKSIFNEIGVKHEVVMLHRPILYPFSHLAYCIKKN